MFFSSCTELGFFVLIEGEEMLFEGLSLVWGSLGVFCWVFFWFGFLLGFLEGVY